MISCEWLTVLRLTPPLEEVSAGRAPLVTDTDGSVPAGMPTMVVSTSLVLVWVPVGAGKEPLAIYTDHEALCTDQTDNALDGNGAMVKPMDSHRAV
jgi:hypothetical protein